MGTAVVIKMAIDRGEGYTGNADGDEGFLLVQSISIEHEASHRIARYIDFYRIESR